MGRPIDGGQHDSVSVLPHVCNLCITSCCSDHLSVIQRGEKRVLQQGRLTADTAAVWVAGKWVCAPEQLLSHDGCVVFSIGSNGEASFESAVLADFPHCRVHTFDPTLTPSLAAKA